ncbi:MAG: AbgT family transporter, partial [Rikenellaceae bacterium]|nr:AbgT family transporter [Rikenellaceae bacterium]
MRSALLLIITDKIVEPRLGKFTDTVEGEDHTLMEVTDIQKKGLRNAGIAALIFVAAIVIMCIPADSFFRNDKGELLGSTP